MEKSTTSPGRRVPKVTFFRFIRLSLCCLYYLLFKFIPGFRVIDYMTKSLRTAPECVNMAP